MPFDYRNRDFKEDNFDNYVWLSLEDRTGPVLTRTLPVPALQTGDGIVWPTAGSWPVGELLQPAALLRWGIIVIEPCVYSQADYTRIISLIRNCGHKMGMTVAQPIVQQFCLQLRDLTNLLEQCKEKDVQLLFVVLPATERDYYHKVKQLAELKVGIVTQCIKEKTIRKKMNPRTIRSILLKVNSKVKGINHALDSLTMPSCLLGDKRVMVVGAHVTHPSPEQLSLYQSSVPSIAAVTASIDPQYVKYNVTMSEAEKWSLAAGSVI